MTPSILRAREEGVPEKERREAVCDRITGFPIPSQFTVQVVPEFLWAMEKV